MRVGAIIQARMSSVRLPGKVLHPIQGKPILQYLLESLRKVRGLDSVVVATSTEGGDKEIQTFCQNMDTKCFLGELDNVSSRFRDVLTKYPVEAFVRINADSPLLDYRLIEKGMTLFKEGMFDIVTNVLERTFPKGQSVEVVKSETFERNLNGFTDPEDIEHVTKYFYKNRDSFRISNFVSGGNFGAIQMSVDSKEDLTCVSSIVSKMNKPHWEYSWEELIALYQSHQKEKEGSKVNEQN
ncbi:hypothetical protein BVX98_04350 [bacterium F11]|nr:hypothetical protein BVX98_04350 [bacterium F11]